MFFLKGHNGWLGFPLSMINFIVIQYTLFFEPLGIFDNIFLFGLIFLIFYIPIATLIGQWDYKKKDGAFKTEHSLILKESPIYSRIIKDLEFIKEKIK